MIPPTSIEIRPLLPGDDAEWLRLRQALWPERTLEEQHLEMTEWRTRTDAAVFVAVREDRSGLAGFAEVGCRSLADGCESSPVGYLEGWYVDEASRRRRVGVALVRAAEAWARGRGLRELASDAELHNAGGQRAHIGAGFREVGRAVLYLKRL